MVVPRTLASCVALLVLGVFQGGLSFEVALVLRAAANWACWARAAARADGLDASWDWYSPNSTDESIPPIVMGQKSHFRR